MSVERAATRRRAARESILTLAAGSAYGSKCFSAGERVGFEKALQSFIDLEVA